MTTFILSPATLNRLNLLAFCYAFLNALPLFSKLTLEKASKALQKATSVYKSTEEWDRYAIVQAQIASIQLKLADRGLQSEKRILQTEKMVRHLEKLAKQLSGKPSKERQKLSGFGVIIGDLGKIYLQLAAFGRRRAINLKKASVAFQAEANILKRGQEWRRYALAEANLGVACLNLAIEDVEPKENLKIAKLSFMEALQVIKQMGQLDFELLLSLHLKVVLCRLIENNIEVKENKEILEQLSEIGIPSSCDLGEAENRNGK